MDLQRSYEIGFRKRADAYGVDPDALVKIAKDGFLDNVADTYRSLGPSTRRAILGGLLSGVGSYALSDNRYSTGERLSKGLLGGLLGGLTTYGLDRFGVLDRVLPRWV